jgi:nicotinamide-nucleotide amidase
LLGRKLTQHDETLRWIVERFTQRKRTMPERVKIQALVPEGARVLANDHGTAPGLAVEVGCGQFRPTAGSWLILLPGPPRELRPMFEQSVVPLLRNEFPRSTTFVCRTLRTTGLGESQVEELIESPLAPLIATGLELAYCAHIGAVDIRLVADGADADGVVRSAEEIIRKRIGQQIWGYDDEELPETLVRQLTQKGQTLALAESCTGGFIANQLTNVPGASAAFLGGVVSYSNDSKQTLLGVRAATLDAEGAVSEAVAKEMAEGARARFGADFAVSVTGIAGPAGGTEIKPVGTVFIGLASTRKTQVVRQLNAYDRRTFKELTARQALDLLRRNFSNES